MVFWKTYRAEQRLKAGEDPVTAFIASSEAASAGAEATKQMQAKVYIRTPTPHLLRFWLLNRNTPISFYNLDCSCRLDGHHTSLQTSWLQSLIQEQWLQLPGTEPLLLQWRTSCTVQRASSVWSASIPYWQEEWPGHFLTPTLRFGFRLCFAWAEKETSILFHPSHIVQRDGQWVCRRYKLSETMLLHCPWYLRLLLVVVMIVVHLDRAVVCNS